MAHSIRHARVSIVVEWENARLAEAGRSVALLRTLRRQAVELAADGWPTFELLVAYDPVLFSGHDLAALLDRCLAPPDNALAWHLLTVTGSGYYRSKNCGAKAATGQVLVFVDSDVLPEPGWLQQLVTALDPPDVQVVTGNTYLEPTGLMGKVFALTWFFPLRSEAGLVQRVPTLFANNLALQKALFEQHPFPEIPGSSRGACILLARQLAQANVGVFLNPLARVAHPAPNGFIHVSRRALAQGRDRVLRERIEGHRWSASPLASGSRLLRHWAGSTWRICTGFRRVGLHPGLIPAAAAVAAYYYLLYWAGETMLQLRVPAIGRIRV